MDRVASRIIRRLHSVFDPDPSHVLLLRVRHDDGATWAVAELGLTLDGGAGVASFDLREHTIGSLALAVSEAGYTVEFLDATRSHLLAIVLLDGEGDQADSNGDHLYGYTSLTYCVLGGMGLPFSEAEADIARALAQLILPDSTAEWADLFGEIFGIPRLVGEADGDYTGRQIEEVTRNRSNPAAIARNIKRLYGKDIVVREPWKEVFTFDKSILDGRDHWEGAPIYQYHTMQLVASEAVSWGPLLAEGNADRPAGTLMLSPAVALPWVTVDNTYNFSIAGIRAQSRIALANYISPTWADGVWDTRTWSADIAEFDIV